MAGSHQCAVVGAAAPNEGNKNGARRRRGGRFVHQIRHRPRWAGRRQLL